MGLSSAKFIVFDVSDADTQVHEPVRKVCNEQVGSGVNSYEVWTEGYAATGEHGNAFRLNLTADNGTMWKGDTFKDACVNAMRSLEWDMSYYDAERNTYWACRFFDNEQDARKSFG